MNISKEYLPDLGVVILTVDNPPLGKTKHTIAASAIADGLITLESEINRLTLEAQEKLRIHEAILGMLE